MTEQLAPANGIEIAYDAFGDPSDPTVLLVMGLGMQLVAWDEELCRMIADRGFHVVRFDNRDVGHSAKITGGPKPKPLAAMLGRTGSASYTLDDMADDTAGLLDHLGVPAAHIVGASMGGMIAQTLAIRHPERVLSLCSIMSTTGDRRAGRPRLRAFMTLLRRAPKEREAYAQYVLNLVRIIGSKGFPADEDRIRRRALEAFDRCHYPAGIARQLVAISASGDRTEQLRRLVVPTVVIHGRDDPLVRLSAGRATAKTIPGAELIEIDGMGHDLPREVWPIVVDAVETVARRAESERGVGAAQSG